MGGGGKGNNRYIKGTGFAFISAQTCCMGGGGAIAPLPHPPVPTALKKFSSSALQHVLVLVQAIRIPSIKSGEENFAVLNSKDSKVLVESLRLFK